MKKEKIISLILAQAMVLQLTACGARAADTDQSAQTDAQEIAESGVGKIVISEVMPKNKATIRDDDGKFTDWVELKNISGQTMDLSGWQLDAGNGTVPLDGVTLSDGEIKLIYTPVESKGSVILKDNNGINVDEIDIISSSSDKSVIRNENGEETVCMYPTPGLENTDDNYDYLQSQNVATGPVEISEVCVENFSYEPNYDLGYMDYVELKNISDHTVDITGWYLTDDMDEPHKYQIPYGNMYSGDKILIYCDDEQSENYNGLNFEIAPFSLDSTNERIYLIAPDDTLTDYTSLKGISYGMTYGRCDDENGYFYFLKGTPYENNNETRARRVCEKPVLISEDGVFEDVTGVTVEFEQGDDYSIYFTTNGNEPTQKDDLYEGPFTVDKTCVVKAVAVKEGTLPSPTVNYSYIINEGDTIPVVSVVSADVKQFDTLYDNGQASKGIEIPGSISYYDDEGSFSIGAGIKMHGYSTLNMSKKNMSFKFRGCYGEDSLDYDIFKDGGVTHFKDLLLRAGGDQDYTIVKNEVCLNLTRQFSSAVEVSRNKYVAVYVNGEYLGIYSLMEKNNENWIANEYGVSKSDVQLEEEPTYGDNPFRVDVLDYIYNEDITDPEVYKKLCENLDIDSLIDWTLIEGVCGNWDLQSGNLRYVKVGDGKWKFVLYDLDQAFITPDNCFGYVIGANTVGLMNQRLLKNNDYKQRLLERSSEVLKKELSMENVWAEYDRLANIIDEEVKTQEKNDSYAISYEDWKNNLERQKKLLLEDYDWYKSCAKAVSHYCSLTPEEEEEWFGEI